MDFQMMDRIETELSLLLREGVIDWGDSLDTVDTETASSERDLLNCAEGWLLRSELTEFKAFADRNPSESSVLQVSDDALKEIRRVCPVEIGRGRGWDPVVPLRVSRLFATLGSKGAKEV
jgi:hypothetical protein